MVANILPAAPLPPQPWKMRSIGQNSIFSEHGHVVYQIKWGPQGFWVSGENGYLFSGSWGTLVIILGELGSKLIILGDIWSLAKKQKT